MDIQTLLEIDFALDEFCKNNEGTKHFEIHSKALLKAAKILADVSAAILEDANAEGELQFEVE